jgi:hypothetical protein
MRDLPGQEGLASQSRLLAGTMCSAPKGRDNLTGPTSPSGSGTVADDFRVYDSETVTTRPGTVPQLILELTVTDRGWDKGGGC